MPLMSAVLSCEPKWTIAKSLTGIGVMSMAAPPTATTGLPSGPVIPEISSATPSATAAASRPESAPEASPRQPAPSAGGGY